MKINEYGFLRVAASSPKLRVADCDYNLNEIKLVIDRAINRDVQILCFPELCITSYSCEDLFHQERLQQKALESLIKLSRFLKDKKTITVVVGLPLMVDNSLFNMAAIVSYEGIIGLVPKAYLPKQGEYREERWFMPGNAISSCSIEIDGKSLPLSRDRVLFKTPVANFAVEIGEDLCLRNSHYPVNADIILNLAAGREVVGSHSHRKALVIQQSDRYNAAYIYASAGVGESTTDLLFSGSCLIAEKGTLLAESKRFSLDNEIIISDIDIVALRQKKLRARHQQLPTIDNPTTVDCFTESVETKYLFRKFNPHPFIPNDDKIDETVSDIFNIQTHGLAKRLLHTGIQKVVIGVSGGVDSTLALLIAVNTFDLIGLPRKNIYGVTMPGFGTTDRTYNNAVALMKSLAITIREIPISKAVEQHLNDIGHDIKIHDLTYENSQARERTQILMDLANMVGGIVLGTGNMSELALGWTTYNADHMSMYALNSSLPKTLLGTVVSWIADNKFNGVASEIVQLIVSTPYSPELLPSKSDEISQQTEQLIGPYELHDFFLYRMLKYGEGPKRILFIAEQAFQNRYSADEIKKWLKLFYKRFFAQQFKRSCMPDGPKVGSVSLSPRGSWHMPSDAESTVWLEELE